MTIDQIKNLDKNELIEFARNFNIWKQYDFPEYLEKKQTIIELMTKFDIKEEEVRPIRNVSNEIITISYNK